MNRWTSADWGAWGLLVVGIGLAAIASDPHIGILIAGMAAFVVALRITRP